MTNKLFLQPTSWSYDLWWQNKCHTNRSKAKPLTLKEKEKKRRKKREAGLSLLVRLMHPKECSRNHYLRCDMA